MVLLMLMGRNNMLMCYSVRFSQKNSSSNCCLFRTIFSENRHCIVNGCLCFNHLIIISSSPFFLELLEYGRRPVRVQILQILGSPLSLIKLQMYILHMSLRLFQFLLLVGRHDGVEGILENLKYVTE